MVKNFRTRFVSDVKYCEQYPSLNFLKKHEALLGINYFVLIYDRVLSKTDGFEHWKNSFEFQYEVQAGETLKELNRFPLHVKNIMDLMGHLPPKEVAIVVAGGGSVGDFAGFIASVFKRGLRWVQLPTTWLAAIDSAHGGKAALNVGGIKNQIGAFHPASVVIIPRKPLLELSNEQLLSGYGELLKMSLLMGGKLFDQLHPEDGELKESMWKLLPLAVKAKYQIVRKDPYEETGERSVLNLGHTIGHALETYYKIPHGIAVGLGIHFVLLWSLEKQCLSPEDYQESLLKLLPFQEYQEQSRKLHASIPVKSFEGLLLKDKKRIQSKGIRYVFLEKPGRPILKNVTLVQLVKEARRQEWVME
ncbi:MAG: 3-dehydroquinate synthase [Bdellovibrionales bacterium]|nr:3-dehydroquinate synthase [Bdellovibrionales bacterium]